MRISPSPGVGVDTVTMEATSLNLVLALFATSFLYVAGRLAAMIVDNKLASFKKQAKVTPAAVETLLF